MILETDRLHCRPLKLEDAPRLSDILGVDSVARMTSSITAPWAIEEAEAWIADRRFKDKPGFVLGISRKTDPELIGIIGCGHAPQHSIMYALGTNYWGLGYASEALTAFIPALNKTFGLKQLYADAFLDNPGSMQVLEKSGFRPIRIEEGSSAGRTETSPMQVYSWP